jgi:hypothetical protein
MFRCLDLGWRIYEGVRRNRGEGIAGDPDMMITAKSITLSRLGGVYAKWKNYTRDPNLSELQGKNSWTFSFVIKQFFAVILLLATEITFWATLRQALGML